MPSPEDVDERALFVGREDELARLRAASETAQVLCVYGVGGIGKSALLRQAAPRVAAARGAVVHRIECQSGDDLGALAARLNEVVTGDGGTAAGPRQAVDALLGAARVTPRVLVIDQAELADGAALAALLDVLARPPTIHCLIGSRARLPIPRGTVDHLDMQLGALPYPDARKLWKNLETLYGAAGDPPTGLEAMTPWNIKRAFSWWDAPEVSNDAQQGLTSAARTLLASLLAFHEAVPASLFGVDTDPEVREALRLLADKCLVQRWSDGTVSVPTVARELLQADVTPTTDDHVRAFSYYAERPRQAVGIFRAELLRHASLAGLDDRLEALLVAEARRGRALFPIEPRTELVVLAGIEALASRVALPTEVRLLQSRILARSGDTERALDILDALPLPRSATEIDRALIQLVRASFAEAEIGFEAAARHAKDDPMERGYALAMLIDVHRQRGRMRLARATRERLGEALAPLGAFGLAVCAVVDAVLAYDAERYTEALDKIDLAASLAGQLGMNGAELPLVSSLMEASRAAAGTRRAAETNPSLESTAFFGLVALTLRAEAAAACGEYDRAQPLVELDLEAAQRAYPLIAIGKLRLLGVCELATGDLKMARLHVERALRFPHIAACPRWRRRLTEVLVEVDILQGQLTRARETLDREGRALWRGRRSRANVQRLDTLLRLLEGRAETMRFSRSRAHPPDIASGESEASALEMRLARGWLRGVSARGERLEAFARERSFHHLVARARLIRAEALLRTGDFDSAHAVLGDVLIDATQRRYVREKLLAHALLARLERSQGKDREASEHLARAAREAEAAHRWVEHEAMVIAQRAIAGAGSTRTWGGASPAALLAKRFGLDVTLDRCWLAGPSAAPRFVDAAHARELLASTSGLVIDETSCTVSVNGIAHDLSSRPALWSALAALLREPDETITDAELVRRIWDVEYHPVRHRSRVVVTIKRLRDIVGEARIVCTASSYAFVARPDLARLTWR